MLPDKIDCCGTRWWLALTSGRMQGSDHTTLLICPCGKLHIGTISANVGSMPPLQVPSPQTSGIGEIVGQKTDKSVTATIESQKFWDCW
ncbi:hypothetical protein GDO78_019529 [Eleutherodactylus coqui]|uniref:Uncharacterized protein n=1 Tax=Eleutherodactylus coqui TaxID=57060 RepID=A0A8J6B7P8_ELECQ|nr:hypothetical protein GDO78_019529 [Eleutherodactylus coqui]